MGASLPHIATETTADVVAVMFKFGAPHHIYIFIFFSISFSLTTYFTGVFFAKIVLLFSGTRLLLLNIL